MRYVASLDAIAAMLAGGISDFVAGRWSQSLYQLLVAKGGPTDTIIAGHGGVATFTDLASATGH